MPKGKLLPKLESEDNRPFNFSFMSRENMVWYRFVLDWLPDPRKPLVCLPCAGAQKTRARFGKKVISQCTSHQVMSAVTREARFERVILSEPLTLIPYDLEMHEMRPDYNLPVEALSVQGEQIFIHQLALWLCRVKAKQPERQWIYYIGPTHHYLILKYANLAAGTPFTVIPCVPPLGMAYYGPPAAQFKETILETEETGIMPPIVEPNIEHWLGAHGSYTTRVLWREIHWFQRIAGHEQTGIEPVTSEQDYVTGFGALFTTAKTLV